MKIMNENAVYIFVSLNQLNFNAVSVVCVNKSSKVNK